MLFIALLSTVAQFASMPAHAFIPVRSSQSGNEVRWNTGSPLTFRVNETNRSGLSTASVFQIFTTSLSRWKQAAFDGFSFNYFQGTDTSRYPNFRAASDDNVVFFTSNASSSDQLPCGTVGLTEVWFDSGSGTISRVDMRFNDVCYTLTNNPNDTPTGNSRIYLGDVVTHEMGHALGLDHSQNAQSTMIYTATLGMATPSCDDEAGMIRLYSPATAAATATLSGRVLSPSGTALFGAHVTAVNLDTGTTMASALSDRDGTFYIRGLDPGTYTALVEPYFPGSNTLGPYYSGIQSGVCPGGATFQRTFFSNSGLTQSFALGAGSTIDAGSIQVSCTAPGSMNGTAETSIYTAPVLSAVNLTNSIATQSTFASSTNSDHYYLLQNQSGHLEVRANSFSLFSRPDVQIEFLNSNGTRITSQTSAANTFTSNQSNYTNYDARSAVTLATEQDVYVHVFTRATLAYSAFPSGSTGVSSTPYYVLSVSRGTTPQYFPANANCEATDNFAPYASLGDAPAISRNEVKEESSSGGCGTIQDVSGGGSGGQGPGGSQRFFNFMGLALIMIFAHRKMKSQLSVFTK